MFTQRRIKYNSQALCSQILFCIYNEWIIYNETTVKICRLHNSRSFSITAEDYHERNFTLETWKFGNYINIILTLFVNIILTLLQMLTPQSRRNCLSKSYANAVWRLISWTQWLISKAKKLNGVRSMNWWNISQQGEVSSLSPFTRKPLRWYVINKRIATRYTKIIKPKLKISSLYFINSFWSFTYIFHVLICSMCYFLKIYVLFS